MRSKYQRIAFVFAMRGEALPLITSLQLDKINGPNPLEIYSNKSRSVIVSINGIHPEYKIDLIGSDYAVMNVLHVIETYQPDLIINAGTAGAFASRGFKIGDVIVIENTMFHDRRIDINKAFQELGWSKIFLPNAKGLAKKMSLKTGNISTGNSLDYTEEEMKLMKANHIDLKDMESAAIAQICNIKNQELVLLKSVTDLVDEHEAAEAFIQNFNASVAALTLHLKYLVSSLLEPKD